MSEINKPVTVKKEKTTAKTSYSPRYPKADQYPEYDGRPTSDRHKFINAITKLWDNANIPDGEIILKLPGQLKGAVHT
jgi:hypothetical protein